MGGVLQPQHCGAHPHSLNYTPLDCPQHIRAHTLPAAQLLGPDHTPPCYQESRHSPDRRRCPAWAQRENCSLWGTKVARVLILNHGDREGLCSRPGGGWAEGGPGWTMELQGAHRLALATLATPTTPYLLFSNTVTRLDTDASFSLLSPSILQASMVVLSYALKQGGRPPISSLSHPHLGSQRG